MKKSIENIFSKNPQWPKVCRILKKCSQTGYSVIAGGAVRDALLGKIPKDFDIATSTHPDQLMSLFKKAQAVGKSFGVIALPLGQGRRIEIATFRKDSIYKDGRRPDSVEFCNIEQDALRRDFTINALYYDVQKKEVIDFVKGIHDIKKQVIRTVGEPQKRFEEDKLRLLRAIRFAVAFDFKIEKQTKKYLKSLMPDIRQISQERVIDEIEKMFSSEKFSEIIQYLQYTNLFSILWPKWPKSQKKNNRVWNNLQFLKNKPLFYWWVLLFSPFIFAQNPFLKKSNTAFTKNFQNLKQKLQNQIKQMNFYETIRLPKDTIQHIIRFYVFYLEMTSSNTQLPHLNRSKKIYLIYQYGIYVELFKIFIKHQNKYKTELNSLLKFVNQNFPNQSWPKPFLTGHSFTQIKIPKNLRSKFLKYMYAQQLALFVLNKKQALQNAQKIKKDPCLNYFDL